jgi:hypothetical protein
MQVLQQHSRFRSACGGYIVDGRHWNQALLLLTVIVTISIRTSSVAWSQDLGVYRPPQSFSRSVAFVPGDAFFSVSFNSLSDVNEANPETPDSLTLSYKCAKASSAPLGGGYRHFGIQKLQVDRVTERERKLLAEFVLASSVEAVACRMDDSRRQTFEYLLQKTQWKPHVCIVNRDFDLSKHSLYLRYNEQWHSNFAQVGDRRVVFSDRKKSHLLGLGHYAPFVFNSEAITEDWRNAAAVKPLAGGVDGPLSVGIDKQNRYVILDPWIVDFDDVAFVAIPGEFDFTRMPDILNSTMIVLNDGKVSRWRWVHGPSGKVLTRDLSFQSSAD